MRLFNTLTGRVEPFEPLEEGRVSMYNCGPTVYKRPHVGNYRAYVAADLLRRAFEYLGLEVLQVMNITDVGHLTVDDVADALGEDKLQQEAEKRNLDPWEIARRIEDEFREDLATLHVLPAHHYPRATEHVADMVAMIGTLIEKGHAYVADGNVYFSVASFPRYGALSGNTVEKLAAGASGRVEARQDKRSPHDFALWKHDPKHLMQWDSPWGKGFPGWHIECSAMARTYLGDTFDIHSGGPDNIFPHHECEIAQSESANGKPFVRHWVHCGWLTIGGDKMAKSRGRMYSVPELLKAGFSGRDIRMFLVRQHYRAPLPFTIELVASAKRERERINNFVHHEMADRAEKPDDAAVAAALKTAQAAFRAALEDDLNTSAAFAAVHEFMTEVNRRGAGAADAARAVALLRDFDRVLGILDDPPDAVLPDEIERLIAERNDARASKDFARADAIRDELASKGIELLDAADGVRWKRT